MDHAYTVLEFWFGKLPLAPQALNGRMLFWFGGREPAEVRAVRDREMQRRFDALLERAASGKLASWAASPRQRLALILLLDQIPRNVHRGTAAAFAQDAAALSLALEGVQSGADAALDPVERLFFYMPLQHAESRDVQEESVAAYRRLLGEAPVPLRSTFEAALRSAEQHRSIIDRFGRFPHRNAALARAATADEIAWLKANPHGFGQ
ncbi:MAG: DUF924 family protein [Steroidobacteraceae bacterium]